MPETSIEAALERAVQESNAIEGVASKGLWLENHLRAARLCEVAADAGQLLQPRVLHALVFEYLASNLPQSHGAGEYRRCGVRIGEFVAPPPEQVEKLMSFWDAEVPAMEPWDAHAWFEAIHPFPDGNGRVGRLLWWNLLMLDGKPIEIIYAKDRYQYYDRLEAWRKEHPEWNA